MNKRLSAGSIVETRCTRCRDLTNHTIVAMVGEQIVRVECNTCHSVHNYRAAKEAKVREAKAATPPGTAAQKTTAPRPAKADPEAAARAEWEALQPGLDPAQALPYNMNGTYRAKELLSHPLFGLGIVQAVLPPNKMDVLFRDGKKRLRCG